MPQHSGRRRNKLSSLDAVLMSFRHFDSRFLAGADEILLAWPLPDLQEERFDIFTLRRFSPGQSCRLYRDYDRRRSVE